MLDEAKRLVDEGVDVDLMNGDGYTPLMNAAGNGHVDIIQFLLGKGANVDNQDNDGDTDIMLPKMVMTKLRGSSSKEEPTS
jgi:ankyrin repeat protein